MGLLYLASAFFNSVVTLGNPNLILQYFANTSVSQSYKEVIKGIILPNGTLFIFLLIIFQASTGMLILSWGNYAKVGNLLGGMFNIILAPALGIFGITNVLMVLFHGYFYTRDYNESIVELLFSSKKKKKQSAKSERARQPATTPVLTPAR